MDGGNDQNHTFLMKRVNTFFMKGLIISKNDKVKFYSAYFKEASTLTLLLTWPKVVCFVRKVLSLHMIKHQEQKFKIARLALKVNI